MSNPTPKKTRRNSEEVDAAIMNATKELIEELGFSKLTLAKIGERANVVPTMFYKRYPDLDKLLEKFTKKYDYWLNDILDFEFNKSDLPSYFKLVIIELSRSLLDNKSMQQLLIYELVEDNPITRRTAKLRELDTDSSLAEYDKYFKDSCIDIRMLTAILISGIYYMILHKDRSEFCGVNLNTDEGKKRFQNCIELICNDIFKQKEEENRTAQIAKELLKSGVEISVIAKCTGLTEDVILILK
ncbi:AcrR family transcriptional regulator [Dysgonomonas alginatilytica]|uniref:AcrR family transcriptional regulator n=1 Tax=Dysgonomonas alginatilytica TaxID=1605892 RepID=A0A2V3PL60_9BACT|nr:TetR/AcrR family transcriptional regulator [Dysgonomonas alginatilytica]PXV62360.1 AcrR family transcriptional regulator [Dysgonomonas alginatilytica]